MTLLLDWLAREGWIILVWWLLATLAGAAALPLVVRVLGALPDRGYTLARTAGILLTAFVFWLLASLGFLQNTTGSMALSWLIVLAAGALVYGQAGGLPRMDWRRWWQEHRAAVIAAELVFFVALVGWMIYRAHQHQLNGTETPMDLAFTSAIMRSPTFPPSDPWLSGFAISYYYFGYVMAAMFSSLSGVPSTIGYNAWTATLFALVCLTTFGVVYNLMASRRRTVNPALDDVPESGEGDPADDPRKSSVGRGPRPSMAILTALFGVLLMALVGNWQFIAVEVPYQTRTATQAYMDFWDNHYQPNAITDSSVPPADPGDWGSGWFHAARAMNDRNLPSLVEAGFGARNEVINEFPFFSYLLADNHPHVMALPFTLLAMGLALNIVLSPARPNARQAVFYGLIVGGLVFLNTWDSPIYIVVLVGAEALRRLLRYGRLTTVDWVEMGIFGLVLLAITVVAYLPFLVGFRSQLGGILPNLVYPAQTQQFIITFGPVLVVMLLFLGVEAWRGARGGVMNWGLGLQAGLGVLILLILALLMLVVIGALIPEARVEAQRAAEAVGGWNAILPEILTRRLTHSLVTLLLVVGLIVVVARLFPRPGRAKTMEQAVAGGDVSPRSTVNYPAATGFALLLIGAGLGLTLIPEFLYLRDNFGTRMNTVFKFYYQAWALWAVAGAYGMYSIFADVRLPRPALPVRGLIGVTVAVAIFLGLLYPIFSLYYLTVRTGTRVFLGEQQAITLDGWRGVVNADDYATLTCLQSIVGREPVVVAEATSPGSYDFMASGRTGALTGIPSVIGWQGHQSQWRGRGYAAAVGSRPADIPRLYEDLRFDIAQEIINRYEIDYILFGQTERNRYGAQGEIKFQENLPVVCESGSSRIFSTRRQVAAGTP